MSKIQIDYDDLPSEVECFVPALRTYDDAVRHVIAAGGSTSSVRWRCRFDEKHRPIFVLADYTNPVIEHAQFVKDDLKATPDAFKELLATKMGQR